MPQKKKKKQQYIHVATRHNTGNKRFSNVNKNPTNSSSKIITDESKKSCRYFGDRRKRLKIKISYFARQYAVIGKKIWI